MRLKHIIILLIVGQFYNSSLVIANSLDTIKKRKIEYALEFKTVFIPKMTGSKIVRSENNLGLGANGLVHYLISNVISISTGFGFNTVKYNVEALPHKNTNSFAKNYYYVLEEKYYIYSIPLMLRYSIKNHSKVSYYIEAGIRIDYRLQVLNDLLITKGDSIIVDHHHTYSFKPWDIVWYRRWTALSTNAGWRCSIKGKRAIYLQVSYLKGGHINQAYGSKTSGTYFGGNIGFVI